MKKLLIALYLFIIAGVIILLVSNHSTAKQDYKAIAAGEKVYKKCVSCHGKTGKGEGNKEGTAINNQHYLNTVSDKDLYNAIKYGRIGTEMPRYGSKVSEKDLNSLVAYMRNWQTEELKLKAPKMISGDSENGKKLYQLYCQTCHGKNGEGVMKMGPALSNPQYLKYTSNAQIWISIAYGRENTRMDPSLKGMDGVKQLTKHNITDIVSYIRSLQQK